MSELCTWCDGHGIVSIDGGWPQRCSNCDGTGLEPEHHEEEEDDDDNWKARMIMDGIIEIIMRKVRKGLRNEY